MNVKYLHTNLVCDDWKKVANFYQNVFECVPVYTQKRNSKKWLEQCTGVMEACIEGGVLLKLPGGGEHGPILEIFQYAQSEEKLDAVANRKGFGHIAFEVDDIVAAQKKVLEFGGSDLGEIAPVELGQGKRLFVVYMKDPEGNIIELQQLS